MEQGRRFGIVGSSEGNLSDLEKYLNETSANPQGIESTLDGAINGTVYLPDNTRVHSRVWKFNKDPWQFYSENGQLLFSLDNIRLAIVRADDYHSDNRCVSILRFDWSHNAAEDNPTSNQKIPVQVRINAADGTTLQDWEPGLVTPGAEWRRRPVSFMQDIDPEMSDRIGGAGLYLFFCHARMYEC